MFDAFYMIGLSCDDDLLNELVSEEHEQIIEEENKKRKVCDHSRPKGLSPSIVVFTGNNTHECSVTTIC